MFNHGIAIHPIQTSHAETVSPIELSGMSVNPQTAKHMRMIQMHQAYLHHKQLHAKHLKRRY